MQLRSLVRLLAANILWTAAFGLPQSTAVVKTGQNDDFTQTRDLGQVGTFPKWSPIEIELPGPLTSSEATPNPFGILVDVLFEGPEGRKVSVPAFYDGDGRGGEVGSSWKVRFSPDRIGSWRFRSGSFCQHLNGYQGTFTVSGIPMEAPDFYRWGRLEAVGTAQNGVRYLKFRDGPFWLKAGCDDPENFLGKAKHFDSFEERMAAIDYLAEKGVNSLYIMTHNLGGDDNDVWPWLGDNAESARSNGGPDARFDIPRLYQWRRLFEHMQQAGVVPYLILEDDSAWSDYDHARYYREMVARFGDLPALLFNLGEEHDENYTLKEALGFMQQLAHIDPYRHPRGIHNVNQPEVIYVESPQVDFTSIQTKLESPVNHNHLTNDWIRLCRAHHQRHLMVGIDEGRPEEQRQEWWKTYLAGGVWEVHVLPPYDRPMATWNTVWTELGGTRAFMETLPFWEMRSHNSLVKSGEAYCLAKPPEIYAFYLPQGGKIVLDLHPDFRYRIGWWSPTSGRNGKFKQTATIPGGRQTLRAPGKGDWALRIEKN